MKKTLLPAFLLFMAMNLQADIVYTNYNDGMRIGLNENLAYDINEDGVVDFYLNGHTDEVGFVPIFAVGCIDSPSETAYTSFDAREIRIQNFGDKVLLSSSNLYDYIDDDRGSMYSLTGGFAEGWADQAAKYIGFALITTEGYLDGWMKVAVDATTNEMIIFEVAYEDDPVVNSTGTGIQVGATGSSSIATLDDIAGLTMAPNPVADQLQVNFDYQGSSNLSVSVINNIGQVVYRSAAVQVVANKSNLTISTADWAVGTYFLRFDSEEGIRTERFVVAR